MNYGERLKLAREHAGLTQAELADKAKVGSQVNISKLERSGATGSEFTVQYALACGISPLWLATGEGEMIEGIYIRDQKLRHAMVLMEEMPEYAVDQALKSITSIKELIDHVPGHKSKQGNGTED